MTAGRALPVPAAEAKLATARQPLADRTIELLDGDAAPVRWRYPVDADTRIWVRVDDVLVVGDELIDTTTGEVGVSTPTSFVGLGPWSQVSETVGGGPGRRPSRAALAAGPTGAATIPCVSRRLGPLVAFGRLMPGEIRVEASDPATGQVAWQHHIPSDARTRWLDWFGATDTVMWLALPEGTPRSTLDMPDPATGTVRWSLPASTHRWASRGTSGRTPATPDELLVVTDGVVVAGVDAADGAIQWRVELANYAGLLDLRATGSAVVAFSHGFEPQHHGWLNISVRERASGIPRWTHWFSATGEARSAAVTTASSAVTHEGSFLRSRSLGDGTILWAMPIQTVPGMAVRQRLASANRPRLVVTQHQADQPWAWLRRFSAGGSVDAFIHGTTGRIVTLPDAFHLTTDGLVLSQTGGTITCFTLPAEPRP